MITKNISDLFKALVLTMIQVLGDDKAILVGVGDDMEYVNDKATGKRLGTKYTVVCPKAMYATVTVKVPDVVPNASYRPGFCLSLGSAPILAATQVP